MALLTHIEERDCRSLLTLAHHDHEKALNQYSYFKLRNRALSNDLVQEAYLKTWSYLSKGGKIVAMKAFLYHVLNNLIVDEYRKKKVLSLDQLSEKGFEPAEKGANDILGVIDGKAAFALVGQLEEKYQQAIRMRFMQDLSFTEMAEKTGKSKNTIAVHIHRGLEKLRVLHEKGDNRNTLE
jgi:RNA polymerase sigma-70 factor (ECF subfamily)